MKSDDLRRMYARQRREEAEPRAAMLGRYRSLVRAAATVTDATLAAQYRRGAARMRARHNITAEEVTP